MRQDPFTSATFVGNYVPFPKSFGTVQVSQGNAAPRRSLKTPNKLRTKSLAQNLCHRNPTRYTHTPRPPPRPPHWRTGRGAKSPVATAPATSPRLRVCPPLSTSAARLRRAAQTHVTSPPHAPQPPPSRPSCLQSRPFRTAPTETDPRASQVTRTQNRQKMKMGFLESARRAGVQKSHHLSNILVKKTLTLFNAQKNFWRLRRHSS